MTTRRITVLIADDHAIVKEDLVGLLKEHDFDVIGAVGDGQSLIDASRRLRPDIIVTDLTMPGLTGVNVTRLKAERIDSKVVVLTMHNDGEMAAQMLRAGAAGFVLKEAAGEELVTAIGHALRDASINSSGHACVVDRWRRHYAPAPALTPRQIDVLRLIAKGQRMKNCRVLRLSTRTVETHKYDMMQVLGVHSTAELVRYAIEQRLIAD